MRDVARGGLTTGKVPDGLTHAGLNVVVVERTEAGVCDAVSPRVKGMGLDTERSEPAIFMS
jgi:hypothetical protein